MAASLSLLRPRSRCSSTANDGGITKIAVVSMPRCRDLPGALHVDDEHDVVAGGEQPLGVGRAQVP